jgi:hypothetical protein
LPAEVRFLGFLLVAFGTSVIRTYLGGALEVQAFDFAVDAAMGAIGVIVGAWGAPAGGFLGCIVVTCVAFGFIVILPIAGQGMPQDVTRFLITVVTPDFCGAYALAYVVLILT